MKEKNSYKKLKPFTMMQTKWEGLWWHPESNCFSSASINLSVLKQFKGNARIYVKKNKFFNDGENGRPNYNFKIQDTDSENGIVLEIENGETDEDCVQRIIDEVADKYGVSLYTRDEVNAVMHGANRDGANGCTDIILEDYI